MIIKEGEAMSDTHKDNFQKVRSELPEDEELYDLAELYRIF